MFYGYKTNETPGVSLVREFVFVSLNIDFPQNGIALPSVFLLASQAPVYGIDPDVELSVTS